MASETWQINTTKTSNVIEVSKLNISYMNNYEIW